VLGRATARLALCLSLASICIGAAFVCASAEAGTAYIDGISDQSMPVWDGSFPGSYFSSFFANTWVNGGHIRLARYVVQWNVMNGSYPSYRSSFESWLTDSTSIGLTPDVSLTSYDGTYPASSAEYKTNLEAILNQAKAMGHAVRYLEPWNEPNDQGNETEVAAAHFTNSAYSTCEAGYGCTVVAGNFADSPSVGGYEEQFIKNLNPVPGIWGAHPYYSVEERSEAPLNNLVAHLPNKGAGEQLWFTEVGARNCTDFGGDYVNNGELGQAERAAWLVNTLIANRKPEHAFYYEFLLGERKQPSCISEGEDDALYNPSSDPNAPDAPRPAASYIFNNTGMPWGYTGASSSIGDTQATVGGSVYPGGFLGTKYYWEYGPTTSYGSKTLEHEAGSGKGGVSASETITGLAEGTVYHYRLVAKNSAGTNAGSDATFRTHERPSVTSGPTLGVQQVRTTLNGTVNPHGYATTYHFEYGTTTSYGTTVPAGEGSAGSGEGSIQESYTATLLIPGVTYHYRLVATNVGGTTDGSDVTFTTYNVPSYFNGPLTAVAQENGTEDVFGKLSNGHLGHVWYVNGYWNGPQELEGGLASSPSAVQAQPGHIAVFWKGSEGNLWMGSSESTGQWSGAKSLGMGTLGSGPHAIGQPNGTIDVFWGGGGGGLFHAYGSIGSGWSGPQSLGGALESEPDPVLTGSQSYSVFWKGTEGNLWIGSYTPTGGWSGDKSLGMGTLGSGPHAIGQSSGGIDVFWGGKGGGLFHAWGSAGGGWNGPQNLGGAVESEPQPVLTGTGGQYSVFWKGIENNLWEGSYSAGEWSGDKSLGSGPLGEPPIAVSPLNGNINVFWGGNADSGIWSDWYTPTNGWSGPENLTPPPPPPTVSTTAAAGVQQTQVTLTGTVNPNNYATTYHFEYGTTTSYGTSVPAPEASAGNGAAPIQEAYTLPGLVAGTKYHYRLVATNAGGTTYGGDVTFTMYNVPSYFNGPLTAVAQENGTEDVFGKLSNGHLGHVWYVNGYWNGPQELEGGLASSPSAVQAQPGHIAVFWKGSEGNLWMGSSESTGQWSGAKSLGMGTLGSGPHAIGQSNGTIDVFWGGGGGGLFHAYGSIGGGWTGPQSLGGALESEPDPVLTGSQRYSVFWKGTEGNLWIGSYTPTGGWSGDKSLGMGTLGSGPHAIGQSSGGIDVFWGGKGGGLFHAWGSAEGGWNGPQNLEGAVESEPQPVLTGTGGQYSVFWKGTENNLWEGSYTPTGGWSGDKSLGSGPLGEPPIAVSPLNGNINVFWGANSNRGIWSDWYTQAGGWSGPASFGS
jgi:hypothetical protein